MKTKSIGILFSLATSVFLAVTASAAHVTISSISGWGDGEIIRDGRWTGQPIAKPSGSKTYTNAYKDMIAVESQNKDGKFTIKGRNFGSTEGSVQFLGAGMKSLSGVVISIVPGSWSDTQVKIVAKGPYTFTSNTAGYVRVSRDKNPPAMSYEGADTYWVKGFAGVIKTRGYGQCTWYVAKRRLDAGLSIPTSAYSKTAYIDSTYIPQKWDALRYGTKHVAIITSKPVESSPKSWSFTVSEMNAKYDEVESSSQREFRVKNGSITKQIGSNAGALFLADAYWR